MDALLTSIAVVALAEIGDKTQLLAILLAARFGRPVPILMGILVATLANHFLAAFIGAQAAAFLDGAWFRYLIAASFFAMAAWALIPDKLETTETKPVRRGAFAATLVAFFLVEIGDKTQIATVALSARFNDLIMVTLGTTLGMMLANAPAVMLGDRLIKHIPLRVVRSATALLFFLVGLWLTAETAGLI